MIRRHNRGFGAAVAVMLLSGGVFVLSLTTLNAVLVFSDQVDKKQERIQQALNDTACSDTKELIKAKDAFVSGKIELKEFGCVINF